MRIALRLLAIPLMCFGLNTVVVDDAEARRFGGGRSIGKQSGSMFNRSATRPRSPSQQAASAKNQQVRQQMSQRGGFMGLLGGLALGGLLGALFFGGAFENLNFLDLLVFGGLAYLLFRMLAARRDAGAGGAVAGNAGGVAPGGAGVAAGAGAPDGVVSRDDASAGGRGYPESLPAARGAAGPGADDGDADFDTRYAEPGERPADFDERAFLDGARRAFELLQRSWNEHDLSEIRGLTTDEMFGELQDQANDPEADAYVQVLKVEAELIDVRQLGTTQEAAVLFDAILREAAEDRPAQVREIWHFTRRAGALSPTWLLEGIEQLEG